MRQHISRRVVILLATMALTLGVPLGVALASHGFNDVPNSNPFHADIDALVDNNVTAGCGNNNYCPKSVVTREQMAAFMNRLGALAPGKTPVVNAAKVDGLDSTQLLLGTAPIPAGTTVTGFGLWDHGVIADNQDIFVPVQLPAPAPVPLTNDTVNFAPNALANDDDPTCSGTESAPTAPAGKVCIYLSSLNSRVDGGSGWDALVPGFDDRGFTIEMNTNSATPGSDMYFRFSWAYTAPTTTAAIEAEGAEGIEVDPKD